MLVLAHAMVKAPQIAAIRIRERFTCESPASSCVDLFRRSGRNLKDAAMALPHEACACVMYAHNTRSRRKRNHQIPPDLGETMRTAGRYRTAASDLKLENPE
jgi:hypothetical protein